MWGRATVRLPDTAALFSAHRGPLYLLRVGCHAAGGQFLADPVRLTGPPLHPLGVAGRQLRRGKDDGLWTASVWSSAMTVLLTLTIVLFRVCLG